MPGGRPSLYSEEIVDILCRRIAEGSSLNKICKDEDMPGFSTVMAWLNQHKEFQDKYAYARELQAETIFDEFLDLADEADGSNANAIRVRVDARKWALSKLKPKKYGDKQQVDFNDISKRDDAELRLRAAQLLATLGVSANLGGTGTTEEDTEAS
jgi:hypothetical protein